MIYAIGHRGAAGLEPENTIRGFKRAIEIGVDDIELDVRFSKDRQIVVIHDDTLDRTTNMKGRVSDCLYEDLKTADAGKGEKTPLLSEVIELAKKANIGVHIEIKNPGMAGDVVDLVQTHNFVNKACIISFWHKELVAVKKINTKIKTGLLIVHNPASAKNLFAGTNAELLSIVYGSVDSLLVGEVHSLGKKISVWGKLVDEDSIDGMIKLGVDAIASDFPDRVIKRLEFYGKR